MRRTRVELAVVLALTLVALAVRLYRLPEIPFGLHSDEAANGIDTLDVLHGQRPVFFERNTGREPLFIYIQSLSVASLGTTPYALRLPAALIGAATIPAVYWMVREAFLDTGLPAMWLALWTALFITTSYWHVTFSRLGFRVITLPLVAALAFGFFWRAHCAALKRSRFPWMSSVLAGIFFGAALYTYTAGRAVPALFLGVAAAAWLLAGTSAAPATVKATRRRLVLAFGVMGLVMALVALPLGIYAWQNPARVLGRSADVFVMNATAASGGAWGGLARGIARTAGMFGALADDTLRFDPALRPALIPVLGIWLAAGVVVALRRSRSLPYLFALAWLFVMALPVVLTTEDLPHSLRSLGMLPAVYLLVAIAMLAAGGWLSRRLGPAWLAYWLPLPFLLWAGAVDLRDYFSSWQWNAEALNYAFNVRFVDAARYAVSHPQDGTAWVLPVYPVVSGADTKFTLDFLAGGNRELTPGVVHARAAEAPRQLQALTSGRARANLVDWPGAGLVPDGIYAPVDAKHIIEFLLQKYGVAEGEGGNGELHYQTYTVPAQPAYQVPASMRPLDASFAGQIRLTGAAYGRTVEGGPSAGSLQDVAVPSGQSLWVVLRWEPQAVQGTDLKVSLFLVDEAGHLAGQVDGPLVGEHYLFEKSWQPGQPSDTYHVFATLPGIMPGRYQLRAAVYREGNQARFPVVEAGDGPGPHASAMVGSVEVTRALAPPNLAPEHVLSPAPLLAPGVLLRGYDLSSGPHNPGDTLPVVLVWATTSAPGKDYAIILELRDENGTTVARQAAQPGGLGYPIARWQAGDVLRDWHDLTIPPDLPGGTYALTATLDAGDGQRHDASLGDIEVAGRQHNFGAPVPQYATAAQFAGGPSLTGYDVPAGQIRAGARLPLTLYWHAAQPMERAYTVFVHLLSASGQVVAQRDSQPGDGSLPTTSWVSNEYIADQYTLDLPGALPGGDYRLEVGLYDATTGIRLAVTDVSGATSSDHILLPTAVKVER